MGTSGSSPGVTREDVWSVFSRLDEPTTPLTATEVAETLDSSERVVRRSLTELADTERLRSKRVSDDRIWWRPDSATQYGGSAEFSAFVSAVRDYAIFTLEADGTVASWNEGAERIKGYEEADIVGEHFSTFYTDEDVADGVPETNIETAATEGRVEDEGWRVREDGTRFWANVTITAVRDDDGDLQGFTKVTRDMTERREYEQELRRERDLVERILETTPIGIGVVDSDGCLARANPRMLERHGIDESNLSEYSLSSLAVFDEEGDPIPRDEWPLTRASETGDPVDGFQCQVETKSGERQWLSINVAPLEGDSEDAAQFVVATDDISDQKARERQLRHRKTELETQLSEILGRISDAFYALDDEWRFTHLNDRAAEIMQRPRAELLGEIVWDVFPDSSAFRDRFETAMDTQEPDTFEVYADHVDAWLEFNVYPSESGLSIYFRDATERRERERELERALDLLERTQEIADVGGWEIDPETEEVYWTDHIFDLLEVDGDEEPPLEEALDMYYEEDQPMVENAVENAITSGEPFDVEVRVQTRSGELRWLRLQGVPEIVDGEVVSFRGAAQNVTERKRREQRLEELIDRLEKSNERLEQFAYAASHDLQEPLRMVSSYLQLLERRYEGVLDEDGEEFLEFAVDGADRMRAMIEGLLEYSRVETRGDSFEPVALETVFAEVIEDIQFQIAESAAEITVGDLPRVEADTEQVRQVLQNLLSNAIEYSGDEPPRIHVSAERNGSEWVVSVRDEGIGIEPNEQERVFRVFQRLHSREEHSGTGIGLALCRRIVERHGGQIWVDSEPGEGSTFSFTLPTVDG